MTSLTETFSYRVRMATAWLALSAAGLSLAGPLGLAQAAAQVTDGQTPVASDNLSMDDIVPPDGVGTDPVIADTPDRAPAQTGVDDLSFDRIGAPDAVLPEDRIRELPEPDGAAGGRPIMAPPDWGTTSPVPNGTVLYGPPTPKAHKGEVPAIGWTEPIDHVPPALEEAVFLVTRNYPSAQAARAGLRAAAADVRAARWLRFPSLQADLAYLDDSGSPQPRITVEAPIWAGGRISANIRRALADEDASSAEYSETVQDLALVTSQTYFDIARLTLREQMLAESLEEHLRLVSTMERRVSQEVSPLADLELARSRAAQIEQEYTVTRSQRETSLRVLAELIADPAYELGPLPQYDPDAVLVNRDVLVEQALAFDPTLARLRAQADVARAELKARNAAILPQLNAQYSYDEIFGSRVGLVVRAQATGGLSQISEIESARLRIDAALENIRVAEQELRRDIASAVIQYEAATRRAEISTAAATTAARVSASYMRQFIAGRRSWLDVMNALREAVNAQIGQSDAELTAMATATSLLLQSGRWRPVFANPEPN